ncbi:MAG: TolC family protein [Bacteroidales bacterium]|nr:TolC family protein [Bacteroidales bacterium]
MKSSRIIIPAILSVLLTGCSIFGKYSGKAEVPDALYGGEVPAGAQDSSIAGIPWREFFQDTKLRDLIDTALSRNVDVAVARLRVKEAEAALLGSKLGFLPSLTLSPFISYGTAPSYQVPLSLSWDNQGLGGIINRKREAQARAEQTLEQEKAAQSRVVAAVADAYFQLILLDRQYRIIDTTELVWQTVLETQKALMENGKCYSTSVSQMESSLIDVKIRKADILNEIRNVERSLCILLGRTPGKIDRGGWTEYALSGSLKTGVPAQMLQRRPDVLSAAKAVEVAYYVNRQALCSMFPSLSLSGMLGWTSQGLSIKDPAQMVLTAVASLTQPIFARGQLRAGYKISGYQQEEAARVYAQTVLSAGNEVNRYLGDCQVAEEKDALYKSQVAILEESYDATRELMKNGKASYIEVLVSQNNLLNAQLSEAANVYSGITSLISLYISLGGGVD